ncbi:MAG: hypothetical protein DLM73_14240 [Chthoniobacterales bacterium]|nr:MAG: hypothetical protein DLM73_14240 [Chthoniobacterales bacterium]
MATGKSITERKKNAAMVALGRLGGLKGGKARAASLAKTERSDIAKKGARAKWRIYYSKRRGV